MAKDRVAKRHVMPHKLIFLVDHTATLVALIHLCSGDLPAACYVYDKLVAVREEWHSILEFRANLAHPELTKFWLEFALQRSANSDGFRRLLQEAVKRLHTALANHMEKEADQVQFFKELRVLNPRRLCDLSHSLADYPLLKLPFLGLKRNGRHMWGQSLGT